MPSTTSPALPSATALRATRPRTFHLRVNVFIGTGAPDGHGAGNEVPDAVPVLPGAERQFVDEIAADVDFLLGIAGVDDFNFSEMWELEKLMSRLTLPYRFETFMGGHEWPPAASIKRAMAWFTLQSMKAGSTTRDEVFLNTNLNDV